MKSVRFCCATIVTLAGLSSAIAAPGMPSRKNYFWKYPLQKCRGESLGKLGRVELCAISDPDGEKKRKFSITIRDPSRLEKGNRQTAKHLLIARFSPEVPAGWYMHYEMVAVHELSRGTFLVDVPLAKGDPGMYQAMGHDLYLLDVKRRKPKLKLAWRSPRCKSDICQQTTQVWGSANSADIEVVFIDRSDRKKKKQHKLSWNGRKLEPSK